MLPRPTIAGPDAAHHLHIEGQPPRSPREPGILNSEPEKIGNYPKLEGLALSLVSPHSLVPILANSPAAKGIGGRSHSAKTIRALPNVNEIRGSAVCRAPRWESRAAGRRRRSRRAWHGAGLGIAVKNPGTRRIASGFVESQTHPAPRNGRATLVRRVCNGRDLLPGPSGLRVGIQPRRLNHQPRSKKLSCRSDPEGVN
jgi:hypothetical protein